MEGANVTFGTNDECHMLLFNLFICCIHTL